MAEPASALSALRRLGVLVPLLRRLAFPSAVAALVFLNLWLLTWFVHPALIFNPLPLSWIDFDTHAEQALHVADALTRFGKGWAYDVQLLAGFPNGTVFDADNKAWELWTFALRKLGVRPSLAFNTFVLVGHTALIPVVYSSCRLFGLSRWPSLLGSATAVGLWYFDGLTHWCWYIGQISYIMVCYLGLLPVALFWSYLQATRVWKLAAMTVTLAVLHLVHPYVFTAAVVPMLTLYVGAFRKLSGRQQAALGGAALLVIGANYWWLATAVRFWHYVQDSGYYGQGSLGLLIADFLGVLKDNTVTGVVGNRTGLRTLVFLLGIAGVVLWRRKRDPRAVVFGVSLGVLLVLAYFSGYLWLARQIQPYRHVLPAMFYAIVPAVAFLFEGLSAETLKQTARPARWLLAVLAVMLIPHLASDALYFLPQAMPKLGPLPDGSPMPLQASGYHGQIDYRVAPVRPDFTAVTAWVKERDDGQARFLVEWWILGEHLAWRTQAQILGGFREINLQHAAANLWRRNPQADLPDAELERYLRDYAVRWVVVTSPFPKLEERSELLEHEITLGPHRIYRTKIEPNLVASGGGTVRASMNRIEVTGSEPDQDVVLRYHFLETLRCQPSCSVKKETIAGDPVGFLRVPAPHPADFVVYNGY